MKNLILVAGGTGDLGYRIIKALLKINADVIAIIRHTSDSPKVEELERMGVKVVKLDMSDLEAITIVCKGVTCVVSALAGLRDAIIEAQSLLLHAAIAAGVPRFIPSDYSSDFTQVPEGENRNFDLRREFHRKLDLAPITSTSIMTGVFTDVLFYNTPFYNLKDKSVGYWGNNANYKVDFTTKEDAAAFSAEAALDNNAPRVLRIASFQISPNDLITMAASLKNMELKLIPMGSLDSLSEHNKKERAAYPQGENELYPKWQGSQYMHSMFTAQNNPLDNNRYPGFNWTNAETVISSF
ncbi:MAG: NmrA family NAD(P)-binding protein [Pyrinomonadaceae bacterium]|nr:NmrA family NAD(P)-binding protein [Sphingobacteriaceae bacterium]